MAVSGAAILLALSLSVQAAPPLAAPEVDNDPAPPSAPAAVPPFDPPAAPDSAAPPPPVDPGAYDAGVSAAFAAQQARLGPLDGSWVLIDEAGRVLFRFEISDPGPDGPVEGAWRDLARPLSIHGGGFIGRIDRRAGRIVLRFREPRGWFAKVVTLTPGDDGVWRGGLRAGWRPRAVTMRRP